LPSMIPSCALPDAHHSQTEGPGHTTGAEPVNHGTEDQTSALQIQSPDS